MIGEYRAASSVAGSPVPDASAGVADDRRQASAAAATRRRIVAERCCTAPDGGSSGPDEPARLAACPAGGGDAPATPNTASQMSGHMPHITPARVAACAALASVAAVTVPTLIGFYVSLIAVAVLLGAAFAAYLAVVDEPHEW